MASFYNLFTHPSESLYLNNPALTAPASVNLEGEATPALKMVTRSIVTSWTHVADKVINVSALTGGITNLLYLLELTPEAAKSVEPSKIIVRLFGKGTEELIDRSTENIVFATLSRLRVGPTFFGLFTNGRIEGYINGKPLEPPQMADTRILPRVAVAVAKLHAQEISGIDDGTITFSLWPKIHKFFELAATVSFHNIPSKAIALAELNLPRMKEEMLSFENDIKSQVQKLQNGEGNGVGSYGQWTKAGKMFALGKGFCHNDLLAGNILLDKEFESDEALARVDTALEGVTLIDFEYAAYNYRAFDLANHFCEFAGFDCNFADLFPSKNLRYLFYEHYIRTTVALSASSSSPSSSSSPIDESVTAIATMSQDAPEYIAFITAFDEKVCQFTLASHLFWGTWAIVQAGQSTINFPYLEYSQKRYDAYYLHQSLFC